MLVRKWDLGPMKHTWIYSPVGLTLSVSLSPYQPHSIHLSPSVQCVDKLLPKVRLIYETFH